MSARGLRALMSGTANEGSFRGDGTVRRVPAQGLIADNLQPSLHVRFVPSPPRSGADRSGRGAENAIVWLGRFGVPHIVVMPHVVVMAHRIRLLMGALYADEYLVVQIKGTIG